MAEPTREQVEAALALANYFTGRTATGKMPEPEEMKTLRDFAGIHCGGPSEAMAAPIILAAEVRRLRELCSSKNAENDKQVGSDSTGDNQAKWQPISTAPKDGRVVLVGWRNLAYMAYFSESRNIWFDSTRAVELHGEPTHWFNGTLPATPGTEGAK